MFRKDTVKLVMMGFISENNKIGYISEVDLEYCKELHDIHRDYPLYPEKVEGKYEES